MRIYNSKRKIELALYLSSFIRKRYFYTFFVNITNYVASYHIVTTRWRETSFYFSDGCL